MGGEGREMEWERTTINATKREECTCEFIVGFFVWLFTGGVFCS